MALKDKCRLHLAVQRGLIKNEIIRVARQPNACAAGAGSHKIEWQTFYPLVPSGIFLLPGGGRKAGHRR